MVIVISHYPKILILGLSRHQFQPEDTQVQAGPGSWVSGQVHLLYPLLETATWKNEYFIVHGLFIGYFSVFSGGGPGDRGWPCARHGLESETNPWIGQLWAWVQTLDISSPSESRLGSSLDSKPGLTEPILVIIEKIIDMTMDFQQ